MSFKLTKEEADRMMSVKGNVRGNIIKAHFTHIKKTKGAEAVLEVEKKTTEIGYPVKTSEIDPKKWYPEALSCLIILSSAEVFKLDEKGIFDLAYESSKYSFVVKFLMKYVLSPEKVIKEVPSYWKRSFDFSQMEVVDFNEQEKYVTILIKGFQKYHPLICEYHKGYFTKIAEITFNSKEVKVSHTNCLFWSDPYEEFKITW